MRRIKYFRCGKRSRPLVRIGASMFLWRGRDKSYDLHNGSWLLILGLVVLPLAFAVHDVSANVALP